VPLRRYHLCPGPSVDDVICASGSTKKTGSSTATVKPVPCRARRCVDDRLTVSRAFTAKATLKPAVHATLCSFTASAQPRIHTQSSIVLPLCNLGTATPLELGCVSAVNRWLTTRGRPPIPKLTKKEKAAFYEMFDSMDADGSGTHMRSRELRGIPLRQPRRKRASAHRIDRR
jgi:hypothetical protein